MAGSSPAVDVAAVTRSLAALSSDVLIASDYDGTLAPIVDDPAAARPVEGAIEVMVALADTDAEVAIISGRPLSFLEEAFPSGVTLVGIYGLEMRRNGERVDHPNSGVWRETMADVASRAERSGPDGMDVELKGLSITLHYRTHPALAEQVMAYAEEVAGGAGLMVRSAKMSVELHPPIDEDKGTALARLAADRMGPVMFAGDDVGDLSAFDALDALQAEGRPVLRVAADSDEIDPTLSARADLVVDGPPGMVAFFTSLLS